MQEAIAALCSQADVAVRDGINIIILSDRRAGADRIPIPSLLACAAVHHHLIREGLRTSVGLVVESGEPREVHHFACLAGYGAEAINPYLAFETLDRDEERAAAEARRQGNPQALHQVDRQGTAQGDVEDGHLHLPVLLRRADFRCRRAQVGVRRHLLHRHGHPHRGRRARARSPKRRCAGTAMPSAMRRSTAPCSTSAATMRSACAARTTSGTRRRSRRCSTRCAAIRTRNTGNTPASSTSRSEHLFTIRGLFRIKIAGGRRPRRGADRGSRAGEEHRQALLHRRHVVRLDLARGAHHARHRHEPHRRQVEYRRGRRGSRPLQAAAERQFHALGDQAGGVRPLRRHRRVSRQRGHDADQDRAGRQARRRRAAARTQGRQHHRQGASLDARRRPHLAAAASRHLFDRRSGAAHLRPQERQPRGRCLRQAGLRSRRRHGCRRRLEGALRPCHHRRLRRRHRRLAAHLDQARRLAVGDRARRDAPDAGRQSAARPHRRAGRRRHPHRPRRRRRRAARRRRVRLRHRAA